jgi:glycosyltransferase involved in cell wall biosynthesis
MRRQLPVIQVGPVSDDLAESVSEVNKNFMRGLASRYQFVPVLHRRKYGLTTQSQLRLVNAYYFCKHLALWVLILVRHRPDVAHYAVSSDWAMYKGLVFLQVARLFGARTIGHLHSGAFLDFWNALPPRRKAWARRQLCALDAVVVLSDFWRQALLRTMTLPPAKLQVVNNLIDPDFEAAALQLPIDRAPGCFLALGVMSRDKGVLDLLRAAAIARAQVPFNLAVIGPERERGILQEVRQFLREHRLADAVEIRSAVHGQEKLRAFQQSSVLVLPSYYENFSLVLLEGAAAGQGLITTPTGAAPEFFAPTDAARFVRPGDCEGLARAMIELAADPAQRMRLAQAARDVYRTRLARTRILSSLDAVYRAVLELPGRRIAGGVPA